MLQFLSVMAFLYRSRHENSYSLGTFGHLAWPTVRSFFSPERTAFRKPMGVMSYCGSKSWALFKIYQRSRLERTYCPRS